MPPLRELVFMLLLLISALILVYSAAQWFSMNGTPEEKPGPMNTSANVSLSGCIAINDVLRHTRGELTTYLTVQMIFAAIYLNIFTISVFGNICVLIAIIRNKQLRSVRNLFIFSLSCSDLVVSLFSNLITPAAAFAKVWYFGRLLCYLVPLVQGLSVCISTFTLAAIAIDRFILIIFPTKCPINQRQAVLISVLIWLMAAASTQPMVLHQKLVQHDPLCGQFCVEFWEEEEQLARRIYGTVLMVSTYALPIVIIAGCYVCICVRLARRPVLARAAANRSTMELNGNGQSRSHRRHSERLNSFASINTQPTGSFHDDQKRQMAMRRRNRTNRMLILMVVAFACCMLPTVLFNLLRDYHALPIVMNEQVYFFGVLTHCIAMTTTVWNPLLYAWHNPQLRRAFLNLLPTRCTQNRYSTINGDAAGGANTDARTSGGRRNRLTPPAQTAASNSPYQTVKLVLYRNGQVVSDRELLDEHEPATVAALMNGHGAVSERQLLFAPNVHRNTLTGEEGGATARAVLLRRRSKSLGTGVDVDVCKV